MRPALAPVDAGTREAAARAVEGVEIDSESREPTRAVAGECEGGIGAREHAALDERIGDADTELARKVVVAGARVLERACCLRLAEARHRADGSDAGERLERLRELVARETEVAVTAGALLRDQAALAQALEMGACT